MTLGLGARPRRLALFITEDWYFWSHRRDLAKSALEAGWDVHLITRVTDHAERIQDLGIELHPVPLSRRSKNPVSEVQVLRQLHQTISAIRPDVLHNVALKPVLYGSLMGRNCRIPKVINALAGLGSAFSASEETRTGRVITHAFRATMNDRHQWVVVQNRDDLAFLEAHGIGRPGNRLLIPGSGVDTTVFTPTSPPGRRPLVATVVSRMLWDKGIAEVVEAARILKREEARVRINLVGSPDPHNPNSICLDQLEAWNRSGVVQWQGFREDIHQVWADSDLAILASYREGMPKSLLEAGAIGRPLIATDVPGCRDLIQDGISGLLVPPRDPEALARAIKTLVDDRERRLAMGAEARNTVLARHATSLINAQFLDLYGGSGIRPIW